MNHRASCYSPLHAITAPSFSELIRVKVHQKDRKQGRARVIKVLCPAFECRGKIGRFDLACPLSAFHKQYYLVFVLKN